VRTLSIVYQDDCLVAVNKPAGLLVHKSFIDRDEKVSAMKVLRGQLGRWVYPLHRLDKATSGVLVFALDRETARRMTESFTGGLVRKSYVVVVRGYTEEEGRIEHSLPVLRGRLTNRRTEHQRPAQKAVTDYQRIATVELPCAVGRYATARYSLINANPHSGRMHQLRRHLKHIFHPVIGDTTYGDGKHNVFFRSELGCSRMLLHCREIRFLHPGTGGAVWITAPLDEPFTALLSRLGWERAGTANIAPLFT
jgi:tRNA pseudouridine65 synthase